MDDCWLDWMNGFPLPREANKTEIHVPDQLVEQATLAPRKLKEAQADEVVVWD